MVKEDLEKIKKELERFKELKEETNLDIKKIELANPVIEEYNHLTNYRKKLDKFISEKEDEYYWGNIELCNHILVITNDDYDGYEGRHNFDYGCIKCDLSSAYHEDILFSRSSNDYARKMDDIWRHSGHVYRYNVIKGLPIIHVVLARKYCQEIMTKFPDATNDEIIDQFKLMVKHKTKTK
jgi:hypothetical protein